MDIVLYLVIVPRARSCDEVWTSVDISSIQRSHDSLDKWLFHEIPLPSDCD